VLALTIAGVTADPDAVAVIAKEANPDWTVTELKIDQDGATVQPS
jgi:hypothetical protein